MRVTLLVSIATVVTPLSAAAADSLTWISDAGGSVTRDAQGRAVAVDLRASWVDDSELASLAHLPALKRLDLSETPHRRSRSQRTERCSRDLGAKSSLCRTDHRRGYLSIKDLEKLEASRFVRQ